MVDRYDRPAIVSNVDLLTAQRHHRLNGDGHALAQPRTGVGAAVIGYVRVFVDLVADTMADKIADDAVTVRLQRRLNGGAYVASAYLVMDSGNPGLQSLPGALHQADVPLLLRPAGDNADGGVGDHAIDRHPEIQADDITIFNEPVCFGDAVHHFVIHRDANDVREALVAQEAWLAAESF